MGEVHHGGHVPAWLPVSVRQPTAPSPHVLSPPEVKSGQCPLGATWCGTLPPAAEHFIEEPVLPKWVGRGQLGGHGVPEAGGAPCDSEDPSAGAWAGRQLLLLWALLHESSPGAHTRVGGWTGKQTQPPLVLQAGRRWSAPGKMRHETPARPQPSPSFLWSKILRC